MTEDQKQNFSLSTKIISAFVTFILASGTMVAWYSYNKISVKNSLNSNKIEINNNLSFNKNKIEIYGIDKELKITPTIIEIEKGNNDQETLTMAFNKLLTGFNNNNITSAIPENTQLMSLIVKNDGIHLNLSSDFTMGGGSTSMISRLGQIIYTASSINPNVNVWVNVDGKPLYILGEEGLMVEQPMTRNIFTESYPNPTE